MKKENFHDKQKHVRMKLLYIDDNEGTAKLLADKMISAGFEVEYALDGDQGIKKYNKTKHDIVVIDYNMPKKDGIEVLKELISDNENINTPIVIMLTAQGNEKIAVEAMLQGADNYLVKDVNQNFLQELPNAIKSAVEKKHLREKKLLPTCPDCNVKIEPNLPRKIFPLSVKLPKFHMKILLAEDFMPNQEIANNIFSKFVSNIEFCDNGKELIKRIEEVGESYFDLIFVDCLMPQMDGIEATRRLRKKSWGKNLKIIAMTAVDAADAKEIYQKSGMDDYILKPLNDEAVLALLERYVV